MPGQRHVISVFAFGSCYAADVNAVLQAVSIHIFFRHCGQTF